jgi:hypothetical protein
VLTLAKSELLLPGLSIAFDKPDIRNPHFEFVTYMAMQVQSQKADFF